MNQFLTFAFNTENLKANLREPWMECYDFEYIDSKIIAGVEKNLPAVAEILRSVEKKATGKVTLSQSSSAKEAESESQMGASHSLLNQS